MNRATSLSLLVLLLAACGGGQSDSRTLVDPVDVSTAPPPPRALTDYLPASTEALITVDVARVLQSPYYPTARQLAISEVDQQINTAALLRLVEGTTTIHLAIGPYRGRTDVFGLVLESTLSTEAFVGEVRALANGTLQEVSIGGMNAYEIDGTTFVDLSDGRWFVGPNDNVSSVGTPAALPLIGSPEYVEARALLTNQTPMAIFIGGPPDEVRRDVVRETGLPAESAEQIIAVAASIDAMGPVNVEGYLTTDAPAVAHEAAEFARAQISEASSMMQLRLLGVASIIERVEVVETSRVAGARLSVTEEEIRGFLEGPLGQLIGLTPPSP